MRPKHRRPRTRPPTIIFDPVFQGGKTFLEVIPARRKRYRRADQRTCIRRFYRERPPYYLGRMMRSREGLEETPIA